MGQGTKIRFTQATLRILQTFLENVGQELSGANVWQRTKIGAGSRYPILRRLEEAGWLTSRWEEIDPREAGRPRQRFYKLSALGQAEACSALREREILGDFSWNTL